LLLGALLLNLAAAAAAPPAAVTGFEPNQGQFSAPILYALRPSAYIASNGLGLGFFLQFDGAQHSAAITPSGPVPYLVNIYSGADPAKWLTGISRFAQVTFSDFYSGIDLVYPPATFLTFRFVIKPGANPAAIQMNYGAIHTTISPFSSGAALLIWLPYGRIGQNSVAYQDTPAGHITVKLQYIFLDNNRFGFVPGAYDTTQPLVIDSTLPAYGPGNAIDGPGNPTSFPYPETPIAAAPSGTLYTARQETAVAPVDAVSAQSTAPANGACGFSAQSSEPVVPCLEVAVSQYSASGNLEVVSYLQGSASQGATAIAADAAGAIYVTGSTNSPDFPVTPKASQRAYAGPPAPFVLDTNESPPAAGDAFVAKIAHGGALMYSTYLGGPQADTATEIHLDGAGSAYVGGPSSAGLPVTSGSLKATPCTTASAACQLGFLAKIDSSGRIAFLTYLPGNPRRFAVDGGGNSYFGGAGGDLGAASGNCAVPTGTFIVKLNPSGSALVYAACPTGGIADSIDNLVVDSSGSVWFSGPAGTTGAPSWVVTQQNALAKLSPDGSRILYAFRFIGGQLALDSADNLSIDTTQAPYTADFARTPGGLLTSKCGSRTLSKLNPNAVVLMNRAATADIATAWNSEGGVMVLDPVTVPANPDAACLLNTASLSQPNTIAPGEIVTLLGLRLGPAAGASAVLDASGRLPDTLGEVQVLFDGVAVPLLYADDGQVNAIAPFTLQSGSTVQVQVQYGGRSSAPLTATTGATASALFTLDGSGEGQVFAINQDGTVNGAENPAALGSIVTLFATGTGLTVPSSETGTVATSIEKRPVITPVILLDGARGGIQAQLLYAGPSPGSSTSVTQLNLRLPDSISSAPTPLLLKYWLIKLDGALTQVVTIALKP
jgi:uncharacterized protein (TIGR03437 family)